MYIGFIIALIIVGLMILFFQVADVVNEKRKQKSFVKHVQFKKMADDGLPLDGDYEEISIHHSYCGNWIVRV